MNGEVAVYFSDKSTTFLYELPESFDLPIDWSVKCGKMFVSTAVQIQMLWTSEYSYDSNINMVVLAGFKQTVGLQTW